MLRPTMEQMEGSLSQRFGSYTSSSVVFPVGGGWWGGGGGRRGRGGGDCGGVCWSSPVTRYW